MTTIIKTTLLAGALSISPMAPVAFAEQADLLLQEKNELEALIVLALPMLTIASIIPAWNKMALGIAHNLPDLAITTQRLTTKLSDELPAIEKAITDITAKIEILKIEDAKEAEQGERGVSAVRALKHGMSALRDFTVLLKRLTQENGVLTYLTELFRILSIATGSDDITKFYNSLTPMRQNLLTVIPQIETKLPEIEKIFDQLFGK